MCSGTHELEAALYLTELVDEKGKDVHDPSTRSIPAQWIITLTMYNKQQHMSGQVSSIGSGMHPPFQNAPAALWGRLASL